MKPLEVLDKVARKALTMRLVAVASLVVTAVFMWPQGAQEAAPGGAMVDTKMVGTIAQDVLPIHPLPDSLPVDARKVALGKRLFHDARLSGNETLSCASCHDLARAGTDGLPASLGIHGRSNRRNAPTVYNAVFNFRQFWDGRAANLEEQALSPITDPNEMGATWPQVLARLNKEAELVAEFKTLYPDGIQPANIANAIAEFERTLITPNAPFDRFLKGEANALSPEAKRGWALFQQTGCISCHQGINVGGNMFQKFGVIEDPTTMAHPVGAEGDLGRFRVTGRDEDRLVFKVPSLRNVALTAPYFEGGEVETLNRAVDIMARVQIGTELSGEEIRLIVAFLESLTALPVPVSVPAPAEVNH
jgi:cytochrome c peroxidase